MSDDMKNNDDPLLIAGHDYDGIQELDNPLPRWWLVTFFGTIIFGILYWIYYEPLSGPSLNEELQASLSQIQMKQQKADAAGPKASEVDFNTLMGQEDALKRAEMHYQAKCASCHGKELQGLIGPNLVDKYWVHNKGDNAGLVEVIKVGVLDKGMPPWKGVIPDKEIFEIVAYIKSKSGSEVPNPKAPEGDLVE